MKNNLDFESHEPSVEPMKVNTIQAKADVVNKEPTKVKINAKKPKKNKT